MEGVDSLLNLGHQGLTLKFGPPISLGQSCPDRIVDVNFSVSRNYFLGPPYNSLEGLEDPEQLTRTQVNTPLKVWTPLISDKPGCPG